MQSPNLFNLKLWKTSGHYMNYKDNIFLLKIENHGFGMKPMNCPAHCLMFSNTLRTYRELPLRFADFGVLHRNEISGALSGLTRVRRFCQDDAHIFCEPKQIKDEVLGVLDFLDHNDCIFGFKFELHLSTRPELRLGDEALWDKAENALKMALEEFGKDWEINEGDGAFYGPKIDIKVYDALKRAHQCGTVQLDFQLPIRFNLQYKTAAFSHDAHEASSAGYVEEEQKEIMTQFFPKDEYDPDDFEWRETPLKPGFARPVIVHRAVLGSVERFMAILIEHLAGKWPFFLSPKQIMVCPVSQKFDDYANEVYLLIHQLGYRVEMDTSRKSLPNRIRIHQLEQWNYILVVGDDEEKNGTVDIRARDNTRIGKMRVEDLSIFFSSLLPKKSKHYQKFYDKIWQAAKYPRKAGLNVVDPIVASGNSVQFFTNSKTDSLGLALQIIADVAKVNLDSTWNSDLKQNPVGPTPYVLAKTGQKIWDQVAMMKYICRAGDEHSLMGSNLFEEAVINQWLAWTSNSLFTPFHNVVAPLFGAPNYKAEAFTNGLKDVKTLIKKLDTFLKDRQFIGGQTISIADIYLMTIFKFLMETVFDPNYRKAIPSVTAWYVRMSESPMILKRMGKCKLCEKTLKPIDPKNLKAVAKPAAKKEAKKEAKKDDDLDLFGSDDEATKEEAKKAAEKAKEGAKGKKQKKKEVEQSLIMFEVKPLDSETNLDDLAKKILEIKGEGIFWKTEYRKDPVAFGIFKLIMGVTVVDELVSVDGLQEKIEALDDMVQSVEITAFTKI